MNPIEIAGIICFVLGFIYAAHPPSAPYHWVITGTFYGFCLAYVNVTTFGSLFFRIGPGKTAGWIGVSLIVISFVAAFVGLRVHGPTSLLEIFVFGLSSCFLGMFLLGIQAPEIDIVAPLGMPAGAMMGALIATAMGYGGLKFK